MVTRIESVSIPHAAQAIGVTAQTLHSWRRKGWIIVQQLPNGRYVLPLSELDRLLTKPGEGAKS